MLRSNVMGRYTLLHLQPLHPILNKPEYGIYYSKIEGRLYKGAGYGHAKGEATTQLLISPVSRYRMPMREQTRAD
jgi:hypothetical protein